MPEPTISLCIIARDEEAYLARCINSFEGAYDELVVVDTGSVDRTVEIAKELGARVEHFEWIQDFSAARNYACSFATKDWILMPDADEYLGEDVDSSKIRETIKNAPEQIDNLLIEDRTLVANKIVMRHFVNRLFKNKPEVRWQNRVHETLNVPLDRIAKASALYFIHETSQKRQPGMRLSSERSNEYLDILKKDLEENPKNSRALFYLANTYNERQDYEEALEYYDRYFEVSAWNEECAQAYYNASFAARKLDRHELRKELLFKAIEKDYRRAEVYVQLGDLAKQLGDPKEAAHWYKTAGLCDLPESTLFLGEAAYRDEPWLKLARLYIEEGQAEEALQAAQKAAEYNPEHLSLAQEIQSLRPGMRPVTVVIPSRSPKLLKRCLASIYSKQNKTPFGVLVVVDGDLKKFEHLGKKFPDVLFIQGVKPFIFSRAVNQAFQHTRNDVVLLNDDAQVETDNWIDRMRQIAHHDPSYGLVSPLISKVGNPRQSWANFKENCDAETEPNNLMFVCVYIKRAVIEKIGNLDEAFIWYGFEDNDYSLRAKISGFKMLICHKVRVRHDEPHSSFGKDGNREQLQNRAQAYFMSKYAPKVSYKKTILYFTWNRLDYTKKTLPRLIEATGDDTRIIVFDNASQEDTVKYLKSLEEPRLQIFLNYKNAGLSDPTNWVYQLANTEFIGKVDNDTLVPDGWVEQFAETLETWGDELALVSGYHFMDEDWTSDAEVNVLEKNGASIVRQPYVGGCCYLMKRSTFLEVGKIPNGNGLIGGWTEYQQVNLNLAGKLVGYHYPLVKVGHLDDPRHPETGLDEDYLWSTRRITKEQCAEWYHKDAQRLLTTDWSKANG